MTEWMQNHRDDHNDSSLNISISLSEHNCSSSSTVSRDSGTSSPLPTDANQMPLCISTPRRNRSTSKNCSATELDTNTLACEGIPNGSSNGLSDEIDEELSDSNDSVFSSGSSIDYASQLLGTEADFDLRDIYLGGSCMLRTNWRQEHAIPLLEKYDITYHLPQLHESLEPPNGSVSRYSELNGATPSSRRNMFNPTVLDASRVLVFVITNETRSLAPMTLAAHCIGLGYNVVLCIQMLSENCVIGEDKVRILN